MDDFGPAQLSSLTCHPLPHSTRYTTLPYVYYVTEVDYVNQTHKGNNSLSFPLSTACVLCLYQADQLFKLLR